MRFLSGRPCGLQPRPQVRSVPLLSSRYLRGCLVLQSWQRAVGSHAAEPQVRVEAELHKSIARVDSDPYSAIMASPLRRCCVTHAVLPKSLMFKILAAREGINTRTPNITAAGLDEQLRAEIAEKRKQGGLTRRPRHLRREAARSVQAALERSLPVLKHKVATSITDESRERFRKQFEHQKNLLSMLKRPMKEGDLAIGGIMRHEKSSSSDRADDFTTASTRYKRAAWCTLRADVAQKLHEKALDRRLVTQGRLPADLCATIRQQLVERVLQEFRMLQRRIETLHGASAYTKRWIIRRIRGDQLRHLLQAYSQDPDGQDEGSANSPAATEDDDVGAFLLFRPLNEQGNSKFCEAINDGTDGTVYDLSSLVEKCESRRQIQKAIGDISRAMQSRLRAGKRGALGSDHDEARRLAEGLDTPPQSSRNGALWHDAAPSTWPRLYKVKREVLTSNLCIALWRLKTWRDSELAQEDLKL